MTDITKKHSGFSVLIIFLVVTLICLVGYFFIKTNSSFDKSFSREVDKIISSGGKTQYDNENLVVNEGEKVSFSSGAEVQIGHSGMLMSLSSSGNNLGILSFKKAISFYANGYMHKLNNVICIDEQRFFDDYYSPVTIQCQAQTSVYPTVKPSLAKYTNRPIRFDSVSSRNTPRFRRLEIAPWVAVSVPYFQIAESKEGEVINVVSPKEDEVTIYTYYGKIGLRFSAEELKDQVEKKGTIGPLTVRLVPEKLTCIGAYRLEDGSCYVLVGEDYRTTSYNVVNFVLEIDEISTSEDYPLLLDIEN